LCPIDVSRVKVAYHVFNGSFEHEDEHEHEDNFEDPSDLWPEAFDAPGTVESRGVKKAIMEAVLSSLPEFHSLGKETITAPELRYWRVTIRVTLRDLFQALFKLSPAGDGTALRRDNGAKAAFERSFIEVGLRLLARDPGYIALDLNLPL
jgi:hypothetical protein